MVRRGSGVEGSVDGSRVIPAPPSDQHALIGRYGTQLACQRLGFGLFFFFFCGPLVMLSHRFDSDRRRDQSCRSERAYLRVPMIAGISRGPISSVHEKQCLCQRATADSRVSRGSLRVRERSNPRSPAVRSRAPLTYLANLGAVQQRKRQHFRYVLAAVWGTAFTRTPRWSAQRR